MAKVTIDEWVTKAQGRLETVIKAAVQSTATAANTPTGDGGRMRVLTGFLRNSIKGQQGSMPIGPSDPRIDDQGRASAIEAEIARWDITKPFYIGWSAQYARKRESLDGFVEAEAQKWSEHVNEAVREAKQRVP